MKKLIKLSCKTKMARTLFGLLFGYVTIFSSTVIELLRPFPWLTYRKSNVELPDQLKIEGIAVQGIIVEGTLAERSLSEKR